MIHSMNTYHYPIAGSRITEVSLDELIAICVGEGAMRSDINDPDVEVFALKEVC
jgi:hypothetical protein